MATRLKVTVGSFVGGQRLHVLLDGQPGQQRPPFETLCGHRYNELVELRIGGRHDVTCVQCLRRFEVLASGAATPCS